MTVEQIIKDHLEENKLDGLYNSCIDCACLKDDLAPCGQIRLKCRAGVKVMCNENCDHDYDILGIGEWHIEEK